MDNSNDAGIIIICFGYSKIFENENDSNFYSSEFFNHLKFFAIYKSFRNLI